MVRKERISVFRKLSMYGFDLVNGGHNIYALLEFDVTDLRKILRTQRSIGSGGSLFAFLLKAVGKCLGEMQEFNSMISRKRITTWSEVDIDFPVEVRKNGELFNKQCIIRDINTKSIRDVDGFIETAKRTTGDEKSYVSSSIGRKILAFLPRSVFLFLMRLVLRNHELVKQYSGTVFVTSVSMNSSAPGFIIPYAGGPKAVSFAIGSVVKKPVVLKDEIRIREMLNITATFNHDLVDGAPAARLINRLRQLIEREYGSLLET